MRAHHRGNIEAAKHLSRSRLIAPPFRVIAHLRLTRAREFLGLARLGSRRPIPHSRGFSQ
jgi:hypothetical protein